MIGVTTGVGQEARGEFTGTRAGGELIRAALSEAWSLIRRSYFGRVTTLGMS